LSRQAGFDAHLVKPVEPAEIRRLLEGYCGLVTTKQACLSGATVP
jgi:hypothetical protein